MFKKFRIAVLLFILATVGLASWRSNTKVTEWKSTLHVAVFPINADGSAATNRYVQGLTDDGFEGIESFIEEEAARHGFETLRPVSIKIGPPIRTLPPAPPGRPTAFDAIKWSLSMRWWAWRNTPDTAVRPDIRIYALYYDPATHERLPHSVGIRKGHFGVAHLFSSRAQHGSNLVVITHELLHTLGASDKYDPSTTLPSFPDGYAEPQAAPLYPQRYAEIMSGRIPKTETEAEIPRGLGMTMVGDKTAAEIGWRK